ncbi:hypothetical protein ACWD5F_03385 [Streptomyces sp. NPDC002499]
MINRRTVLKSSSALAAGVAGTRQLRTLLPADVQSVLDEYEARGDYTAPEYLDAVNVFYANFFCRLDPYPEALLRSAANVDGNQVYATMNGPNEFVMTGNLSSWDRTSELRGSGIPSCSPGGATTSSPWTARTRWNSVCPPPSGRVPPQRAHGDVGGPGGLHADALVVPVEVGPGSLIRVKPGELGTRRTPVTEAAFSGGVVFT